MVTTCASGLGNTTVSGRLDSTSCALARDGSVLVEVPWRADVVLALLLTAALAAACVAVSCRGRTATTALVVVVSTLFAAGVPMGQRAWQERALDRALDLLRGTGSISGSAEGWVFSPRGGRALVVPEPAGGWLVPAFLAGVLALVMLGVLLRRGHRIIAPDVVAAVCAVGVAVSVVVAPRWPAGLVALVALGVVVVLVGALRSGRLATLSVVLSGPATFVVVLRASEAASAGPLPHGVPTSGLFLLTYLATIVGAGYAVSRVVGTRPRRGAATTGP